MNEVIDLVFFSEDYLLFYAVITDKSEVTITFDVFEVISWDCKTHKPIDTEKFMNVYLNWYGCMDICFNDSMHFCGKRSVKQHCDMMSSIIDKIGPLIPYFDKEEAES